MKKRNKKTEKTSLELKEELEEMRFDAAMNVLDNAVYNALLNRSHIGHCAALVLFLRDKADWLEETVAESLGEEDWLEDFLED